MADTGLIFPGTVSGFNTIKAGVAWVNPNNVKADDGSNSTCTVDSVENDTEAFRCEVFDFSSVPVGATIDGIEIRVGDYSVDIDTETPNWDRIVVQNADNSSRDERSSELADPTTSLQTNSVGGPTDLHGQPSPSRADLQDVNFGCQVGGDIDPAGAETVFSVDFIAMKIFYHEGLPTTIISSGDIAGYNPPFKSSGGDFYAIRKTNSASLDAYKTSDPTTDSWTAQDTTNNPTELNAYIRISVVQKGDVLHIATSRGIDGTAIIYEYHEFDMSADTWATTEEDIENITNAPTLSWISIAVRSDDDVIVYYNGNTVRVQGKQRERVYYARREGGTWTTGIALDAGGSIHYGNPNVVKGPLTDDMHSIWQTTSNSATPPTAWTGVEARTLDPSNNLSTKVTDTLDTESALLGMQNAVSYDDSGIQRMLFAGISGASGRPRIYISATEDGSDDISIGTTVSDTAGDDGFVNGEAGICSIAELDGVLHQFYSGGGTDGVDQDLFYTTSTDDGATWSTPTVELSGVTINFISATIYVRGIDTVLAYVYDDGGVQKYNEKVLIAGQTHQMMM